MRKAELTADDQERSRVLPVRRAKPPRGSLSGRVVRTFFRSPKMMRSTEATARDTWQLIHDDALDDVSTEEELHALILQAARTCRAPHADVVRRIVGMKLSEGEAKAFIERLGPHLRAMTCALGRRVFVRVAALDLLTTRRTSKNVESPIVITPSLLEHALEEASADALTGLPQRAHFMNLLKHELRQRKRRQIVVAFLDLDRLKHVNDTFGHARGDEALKALARCGRSALRHGDVLARIGGDEFGLMLVDVGEEEAGAIIARLRERFEEATKALGTSFSAGIVVAEPGESPQSLLARSDAAMYREKRARAKA